MPRQMRSLISIVPDIKGVKRSENTSQRFSRFFFLIFRSNFWNTVYAVSVHPFPLQHLYI